MCICQHAYTDTFTIFRFFSDEFDDAINDCNFSDVINNFMS